MRRCGRPVSTPLVAPLLLSALLAGCAGSASDSNAGSGGPSQQVARSSSTSSPDSRPAPGDHRLAFSIDATERTARLHAPPGYAGTTAMPLVIALHYRSGSAEAMSSLTELDAKADREGFLVAYPEGVGGQFNAFTCCGNQDDVGFVKAVAAELVETWKADPDRVYLTGASNGADLSFRTAVEASGVFAAIAPVSGGFYGNDPDRPDYTPKQPVSVVTFIGLADPMAETLRGGIKLWQDRLKCRPGAAQPLAAGAVRKTSAPCADGSEVEVYQVKDGGHAWFGASTGDLADTDPKINATDVIWDFFAAHPRPN